MHNWFLQLDLAKLLVGSVFESLEIIRPSTEKKTVNVAETKAVYVISVFFEE